ncbi:MAG: hypothetical protein KGL58_02725 [Pseudomonadota bacterium]|nr:hypothetical protein [Pseudomonadota bacterium]
MKYLINKLTEVRYQLLARPFEVADLAAAVANMLKSGATGSTVRFGHGSVFGDSLNCRLLDLSLLAL